MEVTAKNSFFTKDKTFRKAVCYDDNYYAAELYSIQRKHGRQYYAGQLQSECTFRGGHRKPDLFHNTAADDRSIGGNGPYRIAVLGKKGTLSHQKDRRHRIKDHICVQSDNFSAVSYYSGASPHDIYP